MNAERGTQKVSDASVQTPAPSGFIVHHSAFSVPRFVYFDLDDTLLDHRAAERAALADCHRAFPASLKRHTLEHLQDTYHAHNAPLWRAYAAGDIGKDDVQRLRFARTLEALEATDCPEEVGTYYLGRYAHHWRWMDGAEAAFHAVADRYPVGILTNGFVEQQRGKLKRFPGLAERSEAVVISEEVGAMKPDPRVFAHAQAIAGVPAGDLLYVGDSATSDVAGGLGAGWQVAWFRGDASEPGVFVFEDWGALLELLEVPEAIEGARGERLAC